MIALSRHAHFLCDNVLQIFACYAQQENGTEGKTLRHLDKLRRATVKKGLSQLEARIDDEVDLRPEFHLSSCGNLKCTSLDTT